MGGKKERAEGRKKKARNEEREGVRKEGIEEEGRGGKSTSQFHSEAVN